MFTYIVGFSLFSFMFIHKPVLCIMILYSVPPRSDAGLDSPSKVTVVEDEPTVESDESQQHGIPLLFITLV